MGRAKALIFLAACASPGYAAERESASPDSVFIGAEVLGRNPYPLSSRGLRLGYVIAPDNELEITYSEAKTSVLLADFRFREYELRRRIFVDSIFYWGYGLGFRDIQVDYDVFVTSSATSDHVSERHQAITATGHAGIEFPLYDSVEIGSDFVGVSVPLHWTRNTNGFPGDSRDFEEDPKGGYVGSGFNVSYQFFRTYIEVRF